MAAVLEGQSVPKAENDESAKGAGASQPKPIYLVCAGVVLGCLAFALLPIPILILLAFILSGLIIFRRWAAGWLMMGILLACMAGTVQMWRLAGAELQTYGTRAGLGTLYAMEPYATKRGGQVWRLLIHMDLPEGRVPLRLTYSGTTPLDVGARYQVAFWTPPPRIPAYPGAYDSAYALRRQGVHGVGAINKLVQIAPTGAGWVAVDWGWLRRAIDGRVRTVLPGTKGAKGAIASTLMTGHRSNIDRETRTLFQDSGLAHLLAISGLHLSLVAGAVFTLVRALFWMCPHWGERVNAGRVAIFAALAITLAYFFISGAAIPTQRALILLILACLGVIMGRRALSWRFWALALICVLLINPSALFSVSTHLSFLAVGILIQASVMVQQWRDRHPRLGPIQAWAGGLLGTSVAVNLLTVPLLLIHFGRAPLLGVLANLVAVPLAGAALIPLTLISLAAMPLGLDAYPLWALGQMIDFLIWLAGVVTSLPGNLMEMRQLPLSLTWVLLLGYAALLAPVRGHRLQRVGGLTLISFCLGLTALAPEPTRLEHPDGWILQRGQDGTLINVGHEEIRPYDFSQARALWHQDAWPSHGASDVSNSANPQTSQATATTGSILTYTLLGREWRLQSRWFNRR